MFIFLIQYFWKGVIIPLWNFISNPVWLYLLVASFLWFGARAYFSPNFDHEYCVLSQSLAVAVLSGGVWASITKYQFIRTVFSEEIRNVIYSKENLANKVDISKIWSRVTHAMY